MYVDGAWVEPDAGAHVDVVDPRSATVAARVPQCGHADVESAVAAAVRAFPQWASTSPHHRLSLVRELLALVRDGAEEFAALIEIELGASPESALADHVESSIAVIEGFVTAADGCHDERVGNSLIVREPVGVVAAITPWNYPLYQVVAKVVPAVLAGCTVVLKPAELTPLSAYRFVEALHAVGLPPGVVNLVPGSGELVGAALAAHRGVDMVSFTGSTAAGRKVATAAAQTVKRVALELGGKSASIVLAGSDLRTAVVATVESCMGNGGQSCSAWSRLLVPSSLRDPSLEIAAAAADGLADRVAPLVSQRQYDRVQDHIRSGVADGAVLVTGGVGPPAGRTTGYYARPTVFGDVHADMAIAREEIFGPVLAIQTFADVDDAVDLANDSPYGLHGAVWAADDEQALAVARRLRTGQVDLNGAPPNLSAPFGGYKQSGIGRELGRFGLDEFFEIKAIQLP